MADIGQSSLRILVLGDSRSVHIKRYVASLKALGCHVLLASLEQGGTHHFALKHRGFIGALHYTLAASEVFYLVRKFAPDIINPHFASGYGFTTALAHVRKVAPVMLHLWGSDILIVPGKSLLHRKKTAYALSHADQIVADSRFLINRAENLAPLPSCSVIPWGVEKINLAYHRENYGLGKPLRIIVPRPHENVYHNQFIVRALADLINEGKIVLTVPSSGSQSEEFRSVASALTGDRVRYYDRMVRFAFLKFMSGFDVYLSNSVSDSSPASLIEAMGLGLLPVAADIEGVREWLTPDSGFLYQPHQISHLSETIARIIDSDQEHAEMRRRNLSRVKREAIFEKNIADTVDVMRQLIKKRKSL